MIRIVRRQHAVGQSAEDARHPPPQAGDGSVLFANREAAAVAQHLIAEVLPGRRPDLADDREMYLDDRAGRSHLFDFGSGIAEKRLTGEIYAQRHAGPCSSSGSYSGTVGSPPRGACRSPTVGLSYRPMVGNASAQAAARGGMLSSRGRI